MRWSAAGAAPRARDTHDHDRGRDSCCSVSGGDPTCCGAVDGARECSWRPHHGGHRSRAADGGNRRLRLELGTRVVGSLTPHPGGGRRRFVGRGALVAHQHSACRPARVRPRGRSRRGADRNGARSGDRRGRIAGRARYRVHWDRGAARPHGRERSGGSARATRTLGFVACGCDAASERTRCAGERPAGDHRRGEWDRREFAPLLVTRRGGSPATIAIILASSYVLASGWNVLLGRLADRFGRQLPAVAGFAVAAVVLPLLPEVAVLSVLALATILASSMASGLWTPSAAMVTDGAAAG